jgi:hypothetical protein
VREFIEVLITGFTIGIVYFLVAVGFTLCYGVGRVLNYSYGSFFTWGAYLAWVLAVGYAELNYLLVFVIVLPIMFFFGVVAVCGTYYVQALSISSAVFVASLGVGALVTALGLQTGRAEFFAPVDIGIPQEAGTVLLCPDSDFGRSHEWPLARWTETAATLMASDRIVTVAGIPGGAQLGQALVASLPGDVPFFEARPLAGVLPLLAVHEVVLAADGSLPHLAAHMGATCVTLFGPNDPQWKRPLGRRHASVSRHVECAPCFLAKCPLDGRCQQELEPQRVWSALHQVFGQVDALRP